MGGDKESKSSVTIDPAVVARINEITDEAMDLFKLDSDFYKNFMMPFQKDMMKLNRKLLPQMGKIAKTQLRIQQADLLQDKELRDQLRASAKADIEKADVLGEELFGRIMEAADVESATGKKRSEIAQEFGRLETQLVREGIDPTSPEYRAIQKELELEESKQSIQARTDAEQEALQLLSGGVAQFGTAGIQKGESGRRGSMAGVDAKSRMFDVQSDKGLGALGTALQGQNILSAQRTTTTTTPGSLGAQLGGIGGTIIGSYFGGPAGGAIGSSIGAGIGGAFD
jgi:hypothetical protein